MEIEEMESAKDLISNVITWDMIPDKFDLLREKPKPIVKYTYMAFCQNCYDPQKTDKFNVKSLGNCVRIKVRRSVVMCPICGHVLFWAKAKNAVEIQDE